MSSSLVRRLTRFFGLKIINYDFPRWHTAEWENLDAIDTLLNAAGLTNVVGVWQNSTAYTIGQRLIDADQGTIWVCQVNHTSAASGTFDDDRTANPTYWVLFSSLPNWRGTWTTGNVYMAGDIVVVSTYKYYYCVEVHTAGATFAGDASNWTLIFDATTAVTDAQTAATNAGNSATAAAGSASSASGSAIAAAGSASTASTAATNASNSASAAATSASNAATSETNAAASAVTAANVVSAGVVKAVRVDNVQSFTGPEKLQGRNNLGVVATAVDNFLIAANALAARQAIDADGYTLFKVTEFTASGTWTPDAKTRLAILEWQHGGAGGGGAAGVAAGVSAGGGGGGGGSGRRFITSGWGATETVTIAASALGGAIGGAGVNGNLTSIGSLASGTAASGGAGCPKLTADSRGGRGGLGGTCTTGGSATNLCPPELHDGATGTDGVAFGAVGNGFGGNGGDTMHGRGGRGSAEGGGGGTGISYGGGGGGGCEGSSAGRTGGNGAAGWARILEFK